MTLNNYQKRIGRTLDFYRYMRTAEYPNGRWVSLVEAVRWGKR